MALSESHARGTLEMQREAHRLRKEFQAYLEDLELFSNPTFWKAIQEKPNLQKFKSIQEYSKKMGFE